MDLTTLSDTRKAQLAASTTDPELLTLLSQEDHFTIRSAVAMNPSSPAAALLEVLYSSGDMIRIAALAHENMPLDALMTLNVLTNYSVLAAYDWSHLLTSDQEEILKQLLPNFEGTCQELVDLVKSSA